MNSISNLWRNAVVAITATSAILVGGSLLSIPAMAQTNHDAIARKRAWEAERARKHAEVVHDRALAAKAADKRDLEAERREKIAHHDWVVKQDHKQDVREELAQKEKIAHHSWVVQQNHKHALEVELAQKQKWEHHKWVLAQERKRAREAEEARKRAWAAHHKHKHGE